MLRFCVVCGRKQTLCIVCPYERSCIIKSMMNNRIHTYFCAICMLLLLPGRGNSIWHLERMVRVIVILICQCYNETCISRNLQKHQLQTFKKAIKAICQYYKTKNCYQCWYVGESASLIYREGPFVIITAQM